MRKALTNQEADAVKLEREAGSRAAERQREQAVGDGRHSVGSECLYEYLHLSVQSV